MWTLFIQLFCSSCLQVAAGYQPCSLMELQAYCDSREYQWVPSLPSNITHLHLQLNKISEINSSSFRDYKELQFLDLGNQVVALTIREKSFLHQKSLVKLILGSNRNLQLESKSFQGLSNLQQLFLDYCDLTDSILSENFLEPLLSLKALVLYGNKIVKLQPGLFFSNLTYFTYLDLKLNWIEKICEDDLVGFRGKYFIYLTLHSNRLGQNSVDWKTCGNPFKGISFETLDLSRTGFDSESTAQFFQTISGTQIYQLIYSGTLGKGFSYSNLPDPTNSTFLGLQNSSLKIFEIPGQWIFNLQPYVFGALEDVQLIDISRNKINQISVNAFKGLDKHLKKLNLSLNLLGEIYSHTFSGLAELTVLDLSYNHIGVLGHKAFSYLPKLQDLYLTGNSLRNLGFPANLPNLNFLFLGDNRLTTLSSILNLGNTAFYIDVTYNRLTNIEDVYLILTNFSRLHQFYFGGNNIKWCTLNQGTAMPHENKLQILDLYGSYLQIIWEGGKCLDLFDHLSNMLKLILSNNFLKVLPPGIFRGLTSVVDIDLSFNSLTYLEADVFPASLEVLRLSHNFLATPDPKIFESLTYLSLSGNQFSCDCSLEGFLEWLNVTNVTFFSPVEEYRCGFPAAVYNIPLLEYYTIIEPCEEDDEKIVAALKFTLFVLSATIVLSITLSGLIYARLRGQIFIIYKNMINMVYAGPKPTPAENDSEFDAFLCFSNSDYKWVEEALLKKLDNQFSEKNVFRCCFEARDFLPGEDHLSNIRDAIWGSKKTVCIVSKKFLEDGWCLEAFSLAQGRMLEELTNILIMLVVEKMAHYQLMKCNAVRAFVRTREYLTWPEDPQDLDWFYEKLSLQILKDTKVKKFALDEHEAGKLARAEPIPDGLEDIGMDDIRVAGV
ncbi:toll-like receptor 5 [Oryzias latipes]|uniref:Toll like receptor 5 n=1 Tax=Oryzias latipes TaxID=8090 RepID=H2MNJ7_ORYLA|nr:toll-like receptor 5 [Oryzias latipes]XP_020570458.1 toll-like receptor 5 [Oryzias latipes]XP_023808565.1 toll-like receptor 5 [Oryzias latipes]